MIKFKNIDKDGNPEINKSVISFDPTTNEYLMDKDIIDKVPNYMQKYYYR